ncbi:MAG: metallophosphoesterase [Clostridium sp.]|uniref:metallophosphoesterase n=1 Tax=Clostridium sp. TaxID=1506 RepID=UPI003EE72509
MTNAYAAADWHLGHENILQYRPQFKTIEEHDKYIVDRCNEIVNPTDTLILVGDIILSDSALAQLDRVHCRNVILVPGNHDGERCMIPFGNFKRVTGALVRRLPNHGQVCVFSHIPVHPMCLDRWQVNVHGHKHDSIVQDDRYFNCTLDLNNCTPVALDHIAETFKERGIVRCS